MLEEETQHLPGRVRPAGIGVGPGRTASRPGMAGPVDAPVLGRAQATFIGEDGAGIRMSLRYSPAKSFRPRACCSFARPTENQFSIARMHGGIAIAMEDDGGNRGASSPDCCA